MRLVSIGSFAEDAATVALTRSELRVIIGGLSEALFEIEPDEFAIRVGLPAEEAKAFVDAMREVRDTYDAGVDPQR